MGTQRHELDGDAVARLVGRSLPTTQEWSVADLRTVLDLTRAFADLDRAAGVPELCPRELAYGLFFDRSTRTRSAWSGAAARLGMHPVIVDGSSTQVAHGETAVETGAMLGMNAHALGVRHDLVLGAGNAFLRDIQRGIDGYLAATGDPRGVPVVNLQCDVDHPTQTLADLAWLEACFPDGLEGRPITVSWANSPAYAKPLSVPQGLITLLTRFGAAITLARPEGYDLSPEALAAAEANAAEAGGSFRVVDDMDEAFRGAHAVYPKSWGPLDLMQERVAADAAGDPEALEDIEARALARNATHADWICDERRMALTEGGSARYLHCLPADIGAEVTPGVMAAHADDVAREANGKVYVIMALLAGAKVPDLAERLTAAARSPR